MQKIWNNLVDGIRRFCRENNFSDAALGLSGGLDSAITAVAAAEALGGDHVHALMMKTRYTSDLSLEIAAEIAKLNGLDYKTADIQPVIDAQQKFLNELFGEQPKILVLGLDFLGKVRYYRINFPNREHLSRQRQSEQQRLRPQNRQFYFHHLKIKLARKKNQTGGTLRKEREHCIR